LSYIRASHGVRFAEGSDRAPARIAGTCDRDLGCTASGRISPACQFRLASKSNWRSHRHGLDEFQRHQNTPGFPTSAAATLQKAWAQLQITELAKTSDALVARALTPHRLEAEVLKRLPPSMRRPADLVSCASAPCDTRRLCRRDPRARQNRNVAKWRPFLAALRDVTDVQWIAIPRQVPAGAKLGMLSFETAQSTLKSERILRKPTPRSPGSSALGVGSFCQWASQTRGDRESQPPLDRVGRSLSGSK